MIVLDASAATGHLLDLEPQAQAIERRLSGGALHVPHVFDVEVVQAVRRQARRGLVSDAKALDALGGLSDLPLTRYPHLPLVRRMWELRENVSPADAAYLALAEALELPLVTLDTKLEGVPGIQARVEVL
ncbi:MAG: PIN domain-containing protein [Thermoleophilaceae bacterium]|nr:PIN domain-containing protein [Thermoleophilaceae bacterium]